MRYFIDTEFIERGPNYPIKLISIGIVDDGGREFYRENKFIYGERLTPWLRDNVWPHLLMAADDYDPIWNRPPQVSSPKSIAAELLMFIGDDPAPEFWGYYCAYDWVIFCQLFGDMSEKPARFPYYCRDLKQAIDEADWGLMHPGPNQPDDTPHNALEDARWIRQTWGKHFSANPSFYGEAAE